MTYAVSLNIYDFEDIKTASEILMEVQKQIVRDNEPDLSDTVVIGSVVDIDQRKILGRSLEEWQDFAKQDDCLEKMVPSDLRMILQAIRELDQHGRYD